MFRFSRVAVALLPVVLTACSADPQESEFHALAAMIQPARAEPSISPTLTRDTRGFHATWQFTVPMEWAAYGSWVEQRLPAGYTRRPTPDARRAFTRSTDNDVYLIALEPAGQLDGQTIILATFSGNPF